MSEPPDQGPDDVPFVDRSDRPWWRDAEWDVDDVPDTPAADPELLAHQAVIARLLTGWDFTLTGLPTWLGPDGQAEAMTAAEVRIIATVLRGDGCTRCGHLSRDHRDGWSYCTRCDCNQLQAGGDDR